MSNHGMVEGKFKVVAQKADPQAVITKTPRGGFQTTIINVLEDGRERPFRVSTTRKRDLLAKLQKLPIGNVRGMHIDSTDGIGFVSIELFAYNGV